MRSDLPDRFWWTTRCDQRDNVRARGECLMTGVRLPPSSLGQGLRVYRRVGPHSSVYRVPQNQLIWQSLLLSLHRSVFIRLSRMDLALRRRRQTALKWGLYKPATSRTRNRAPRRRQGRASSSTASRRRRALLPRGWVKFTLEQCKKEYSMEKQAGISLRKLYRLHLRNSGRMQMRREICEWRNSDINTRSTNETKK